MAGPTEAIHFFPNNDGAANSPGFQWRGGNGTFYAVGTFNGGTVKLQMSPDNGATWIDVGASTTLTAAGYGNFLLAPCLLRAGVTGGPPAAINAGAASCRI